jgi:hypothetical protein
MEFPFSLIAAPSRGFEGASPALNQIRPGWVLRHNAYGLERQERSLAARWRGGRWMFPIEALRLEWIEALEGAESRLASVGDCPREFYTENEIQGLGKNILTESDRIEALEIYSWARRVIAARRLLVDLEAAVHALQADAPAGAPLFSLDVARQTLGASVQDTLVTTALEVQEEWLAAVRASKARDDLRGEAIFEDYARRHLTIDRDPWIETLERDWAEKRSRRESYEAILARAIAGDHPR